MLIAAFISGLILFAIGGWMDRRERRQRERDFEKKYGEKL